MSHQKKTEVRIEGMTCGSCEILIERKLRKIPGVKSVKVSHNRGKAFISYEQTPSIQELQEAIAGDGYKIIVDGKPVTENIVSHKSKNTFKDYCEMSAMALIVFGLYLILRQFNFIGGGLGITENMNYGLVFLIGLVAASSSCIAVAGGVLLSVAAKYNQNVVASTTWQKFKPHLYFNVARIVSYTVLGGVLGLIGSALTISPAVTGAISLLASLFMIFMGLNILHLFPWIGKLMPKPPKFLSHSILNFDNRSGKWIPFIMGALTFFLPCGFTQAFQIYVISKGSLMQGALTMFFFSVGTLPALLSLSALSSFAKGWFQRYFLKFSGVLVLIIGMSNIGNSFALLGISNATLVNISQQSSGSIDKTAAETFSRIENGRQIVEMTVNGYQYTPNRFKVYQGIPVEWRVDGRNATGCGRVLSMPGMGITELMPSDSVKIINFTPKDAGVYSFNCTMGMMTPNSAFIVVPGSPAAADAQPAAATSPSVAPADQPTPSFNLPAAKSKKTEVLSDLQTSAETSAGVADQQSAPVAESAAQTPVAKPAVAAIQKVLINASGSGFTPQLITVKKGIPVEFIVNAQADLSGCMSAMVIPALGVSHGLQFGQNTFTFTPNQTGEFDVTCPMGIYETTLQVIN